MKEIEAPISAENSQNTSCAVDPLIRFMPADMPNTTARGANITMYFCGPL